MSCEKCNKEFLIKEEKELNKRHKQIIAGYMAQNAYLDKYIDKFIENFDENFIGRFHAWSSALDKEVPGFNDPLTFKELEEFFQYKDDSTNTQNLTKFRLEQLKEKGLITFFEFVEQGNTIYYVFKE